MPTDYSVSDPRELMNAFYEIGQEAILSVIETTSAPHDRKQLRTWGINAVSTMLGKASNTIRAAEKKNKITISTDENGRKQYTLNDINRLRDILAVRIKKPENVEPIVCSVLNFKGGVAKTMTTLLLMQFLAIRGLRVLGIDLDPQATLTTWFGYIPDIDLKEDDTLATTLLEDTKDIKRVIKKTFFTGIDLIPSNLELENARLLLPGVSDEDIAKNGSPLRRLDKAIELIKDDYDVILIDCPPSTGALTMNAVSSVNSMLVTVPPSMPDFASFVRLSKTLNQVFRAVDLKSLDFLRILLTKHKQNGSANKMDQLMRAKYGKYILVNHMVDSAEIDNTASAIMSLYEKPYATGNTTYRRAVEACDKVNNEIFGAFREIWASKSPSTEKGEE